MAIIRTTQDAGQRQGEIMAFTHQIETQVTEMSDAMNRLEERLAPVLSNVGLTKMVEPGGGRIDPEKPHRTKLGGDLYTLKENLQSLNSRLHGLLDGLEL